MSLSVVTDALVLKQFDIQDFDVLYICFTRKFGKIPVLAKGIRRPQSKRRSLMQTGNVVRMQILEWSNKQLLKEVTLCQAAFAATASPTLVSYLFHMVELLDVLLPEQENHEDLFDLTVQLFEDMWYSPRQVYVRYFEVQLLRALGYLPDEQSLMLDSLEDVPRKMITNLAQAKLSHVRSQSMSESEHRDLTDFLHHYLEEVAERPLKSLAFFAS